MSERATFEPDWVSPPGDTIADALDELGMTQAELAQRTSFTKKHINGLIGGKVAITADAALRLEAVLGEPASFWLQREANYREALARRSALERAAAHKTWLKEVPLAWLIKRDWVDKCKEPDQQVLAVLRFFGVADVEGWREQTARFAPAFRASPAFPKQRGAVATWLRGAELSAQHMTLGPFDKPGLRSALGTLRALTTEPDPAVFVPTLQATCAERGVAVVFVPPPPGCPVSGATWWAGPERAVLALSLRHKSDDHLWFSLFHELGHLLLHGKKLLFVEGLDGLSDEQEDEADAFARRELITDEKGLQRLAAQRPLRADDVRAFATRLGIAPGIVLGRLQHDKVLHYSQLKELKQRFEWAEEE